MRLICQLQSYSLSDMMNNPVALMWVLIGLIFILIIAIIWMTLRTTNRRGELYTEWQEVQIKDLLTHSLFKAIEKYEKGEKSGKELADTVDPVKDGYVPLAPKINKGSDLKRRG